VTHRILYQHWLIHALQIQAVLTHHDAHSMYLYVWFEYGNHHTYKINTFTYNIYQGGGLYISVYSMYLKCILYVFWAYLNYIACVVCIFCSQGCEVQGYIQDTWHITCNTGEYAQDTHKKHVKRDRCILPSVWEWHPRSQHKDTAINARSGGGRVRDQTITSGNQPDALTIRPQNPQQTHATIHTHTHTAHRICWV
jgi:hypothetical protein